MEIVSEDFFVKGMYFRHCMKAVGKYVKPNCKNSTPPLLKTMLITT